MVSTDKLFAVNFKTSRFQYEYIICKYKTQNRMNEAYCSGNVVKVVSTYRYGIIHSVTRGVSAEPDRRSSRCRNGVQEGVIPLILFMPAPLHVIRDNAV